MSFNADQLKRLLPAGHRLRDANAMGTVPNNPTPGSLDDLIGIIADQVAVLEEDLAQLYDNQFVETAAPWALPYLGELLGLSGVNVTGGVFAPRAEVANTIAYRRRKGTGAMLEQLARDILGRPCAAVEFWRWLTTTQHVNHVRLKTNVQPKTTNAAWATIRNAPQLEFISTPFETATRTLEVRRIEPGLGKWNIPNVGLFGWRLRNSTRTFSPLAPAHIDDRHLRLHPLGLDIPLCARPETETDIAHLARPENVPVLLTWRLFAGDVVAGTTNQFHPAATWYGPDRSVQLWRIVTGKWSAIPAEDIVVCDLHDVIEAVVITRWGHDLNTFGGLTKILLDPVRGRVVMPAEEEVFATFSTLFPGDVGGGEYARAASFGKSSAAGRFVTQQPQETIVPGILSIVKDAINAGTAADVIIEIADSGHYIEKLPDFTANDVSVELRAEDGRWPALTLTDIWTLTGNDAGNITLNGLLITGHHLKVTGTLGALNLQHCTLMAYLNVGVDGRVDLSAPRPAALEITAPGTKVELENCIIGPLRVAPDVTLTLRNCIVDAGARDRWALCSNATDGAPAGICRIENCTIVGRVAARGIELASNTIFFGDKVSVERRQEGCVRFCWLPDNAIVPRRYKCVPRVEKDNKGKDVDIDGRPQFVSLRFGDMAFGQLSRSCPDPIRLGADDESEMGVYHDLMEPRREAHLRARLRDYLRFGLEAGIFYEQQTPRISGDIVR